MVLGLKVGVQEPMAFFPSSFLLLRGAHQLLCFVRMETPKPNSATLAQAMPNNFVGLSH